MKTQLINFTIPNELLEKVDSLAKEQSRSRSEVLREAARYLINEVRKSKRDFAIIRRSGKKVNLTEDEAIALVDKARSTLPINK